MKKTFLLIIAALFVSVTFAQQQQERIIRFHSDIKIENDGTVEVAEHIKVYAGGEDIKRGIIREIPCYRKNKYGDKVRIGINVISVTCNGEKAVYNTDTFASNLEIRIGEAEVLLEPGEYEYVITYSSRGHIGFFEGFDELYWNVTGTEWEYSIEAASATVTLPDGVKAIKTYAYTGKEGESGQDYTVENLGNVQIFTVTRKFNPHENLTIAVAFPAGIIERPPPETFFNSTKGVALIFFLITVFTFAVLFFTERRRKSGLIIPRFAPPNNWSPGMINYMYKGQYDAKGFTAIVIQMAIKGALTIGKWGKKYVFTNTSNVSQLNEEELSVHAKLFENNINVIVEKHYRDTLQCAQSKHETEIKKKITIKDYWFDNSVRVLLGFAAVFVILLVYYIRSDEDDFILAVVISIPFMILPFSALFRRKHTFVKTLIIAILYSVPMFLLMYLLDSDFDSVHTFLLIASTSLCAVYSFFSYHYPNEQGRKALDDIEGFRMYMKTAEEHRLNLLNAPEQTPEHFEKMLPYAIALGVVKQWSKKFASVLEATNYQPVWSDEKFKSDDWERFDNSFVHTLNRSIASSSREKIDWSSSSGSSDWSSGSDGGGSSGGGGGGGGGRGW